MPLTDLQIRKAKPQPKAYKMVDGQGLYLHVTPAGGKHWRMRYELPGGREKLLSFGPYPDVSLMQARDERAAAKRLLREKRDPAELRKAQAVVEALPTFEQIARQWFGIKAESVSPHYAGQILKSLEQDVFPTIGGEPIARIEAPKILDLLRVIELRGAVEQAHRVRQRISDVYTFAIAMHAAPGNPAAGLTPALRKVVKGKQPALLDLPSLLDLIRRVEAEDAYPGTRLAVRLLMLTAQRPGEITGARISEFEGLSGQAPIWRIPAERMKKGREHWVPLSRQATEVVLQARSENARRDLLFTNVRRPARPMTPNAMGYLLNRAGYLHRHVPHGFRASFSTIMNERYRPDRQVIDLMLSHGSDDRTESAYNRALHLDRRRELAQIWADLISPAMMPINELVALKRSSQPSG